MDNIEKKLKSIIDLSLKMQEDAATALYQYQLEKVVEDHDPDVMDGEPETQPEHPQREKQPQTNYVNPFEEARIEKKYADYYLKKFWGGRPIEQFTGPMLVELQGIVKSYYDEPRLEENENLINAFIDDCRRLSVINKDTLSKVFVDHTKGGLGRVHLWALVGMMRHAEQMRVAAEAK